MPQFTRAIHVALTVRDRHESAEWYERVLPLELWHAKSLVPAH
jgi:catechol 2,3-dioxygenase-like lactoylglutathione lyase family enzyme